jgi:aprataxin and PNK-like factor
MRNSLLELCKWGASCTRKNPAHLAQFDHPESSEVSKQVQGDSNPRIPCKYGNMCTRKNAQHFVEFSHPENQNSSPGQLETNEFTDADFLSQDSSTLNDPAAF